MQPAPALMVTSSSPIEEPAALRRPLNLGIATAAANTAARTAAAAQRLVQHQPHPAGLQQQQQQSQSRVQQKLQRNNNNAATIPAMNVLPAASRDGMPPLRQDHVQQQLLQQQRGAPRQAGPGGMRPFELRNNNAVVGPPSIQQPPNQARRPTLPVLQVTVPQPTVHQPTHARPPQSQQQQYRPPQQRQGGGQPPSPFSSSSETLVGSSPNDKSKYGNNGINQKNWSPSSSTSSSSHTHHNTHQHVPPSPVFAGGHHHPNSPYGNPPSSPSIKNFQLQVPSNDGSLVAHPDNDRLSPAMPRQQGANQRDWWKRFSHVIKENEVKEQLAEKSGSKGSKVQSEWLDAEAHKQRKYRIWVAVVAFIILAAIGGGVAYHYVTKDKDSENAVTQPTTHGFEGTDSESSTNIAAATQASTSVALAAPSAVPAGNIIGTRDNALQKRGQGHQTQHIGLLAARSMHAHARIHKDLHKLD